MQRLLIGIIVSAVVLGVMGVTFVRKDTTLRKVMTSSQDQNEVRETFAFLRKLMGGGENFDGLSLNFPLPKGDDPGKFKDLQNIFSDRTGFIVDPNTDILRNSSSGNDTLYWAKRKSNSPPLKLVNDYNSSPTLQLELADGAIPTVDQLSVGNFIALSLNGATEISLVTAVTGKVVTLDLTRFPIAKSYNQGMTVYVCELWSMGINGKDLVVSIFNPGQLPSSFSTLAKDVDSFSIQYQTREGSASEGCSTVADTDTEKPYSRSISSSDSEKTAWQVFNSDTTQKCYNRLKAIRITISKNKTLYNLDLKTNN